METVREVAEGGPPRVFLSFSRERWTSEARVLSDALRDRGAEVQAAPEPQPNESRLSVALQIGVSDIVVVLVAPGEEAAPWMLDNVRQILRTGWERPDLQVVVVAPAVGAIPSGLRGQQFLRYVAHDDAQLSSWALEPVAVQNFASAVLATRGEGTIGEMLASADVSQWRNQLVHVGSSVPLNDLEVQAIRRRLLDDIDGLAPLVRRAVDEGARFTSEDSRAVLDRALLALSIHDDGLIEAYFAVAAVVRRLSPSEPDDGGNSLDYALGLLAYEAGDLHAAREFLSVALSDDERSLGRDHPATIAVLVKLADTEDALGDTSSSLMLLNRALASADRSLGPDHPEAARISYRLGVLMMRDGDRDGARLMLERAAESFSRVSPPESSELRAAREQLTAIG